MRTPHSTYPKGKRVWVRLKSGREIIDRFVERRGRFVVLDNHRLEMVEVSAMNRYRPKT